ncbi:SDR family oxidoreductase [soil metagenome]
MKEHELSLVTGGGGFIGSHLVEALLARGDRVRIFDNFSTGSKNNLKGMQPAPEIIEADLNDPAAVDHAMQGVSTVYHLAALASVARSIETPLVTHQACVTGTLHVLDAARRHGVRRLVFSASSSAYGGRSMEGGQREDMPVMPQSPYAAAKLAGEMYLQAFAAAYRLECVSLRFFNIFGPRQRSDSPYSGVIALFCDAMLAGRAPVVHGDGLQSRDFTFVANAVTALLGAGRCPNTSGKVYNVGTGMSITLLELIAALNKLLGTRIVPQLGSLRAGDVRHSLANIERARQDLGYEVQVSFEEGLSRTLKWYQELGGAN